VGRSTSLVRVEPVAVGRRRVRDSWPALAAQPCQGTGRSRRLPLVSSTSQPTTDGLTTGSRCPDARAHAGPERSNGPLASRSQHGCSRALTRAGAVGSRFMRA
jgi:hypothetical protein